MLMTFASNSENGAMPFLPLAAEGARLRGYQRRPNIEGH